MEPTSPPRQRRRNIVVFSGGSAANSLVDVFEQLRAANDCHLSYVIPISDNGGSSSEIIRVFGGPGIGDVRSRLVRLIPAAAVADPASEPAAVHHCLHYRLPRSYPAARDEWHDILEGAHPLWTHISSPKRELLRAFLNSFNLEAVRRMRPSSRFDFSGASVGNLFLTGARLFTGSFEAAIYLLASVCEVPQDRVSVLPAINSNFAHHIAAGLADGSVILGQNNISHPSVPTAAVPTPPAAAVPTANLLLHPQPHGPVTPSSCGSTGPTPSPSHTPAPHAAAAAAAAVDDDNDHIEDANLPGTLSALRQPALAFSKDAEEDLPAPIQRVWYINPYGQEIRIPANPRVLAALAAPTAIIYSIGSLYTSLVPSLVLRGVGDAVAAAGPAAPRILLLNGSLDRESGPSSAPLDALGFVAAIARACAGAKPPEAEYARYVSHVVYLDTPAAPAVDSARLRTLGIEPVRLYGRAHGRYDQRALAQALEAIVGSGEGDLSRGERPGKERRRNTLVG